jgi:hypothetical protein
MGLLEATMKKSTRARGGSVALAGWLFADLFLGIAMFFLVIAEPPRTIPTPTATPPAQTVPVTISTPTATASRSATPTSTRTSSPTPSHTPTPANTPTRTGGLDPTPLEVKAFKTDMQILLGPDAPRRSIEEERIRRLLHGELDKMAGERAGMVLCFGTALPSRSNEGVLLSRQINGILRTELPQMFGDFTVFKDYLNLTSDPESVGYVTIEIYWITDSRR